MLIEMTMSFSYYMKLNHIPLLIVQPWDVVFYAGIIVIGVIVLYAGMHYMIHYLKRRRNNDRTPLHNHSESLVDHFPGMAYRCLYDANWTMKFVSEGTKELTGYECGALLDNTVVGFKEVIHPLDRARVRKAWDKAVESEQAVDIEYRIITKNRELLWVRETGRAVYDSEKHAAYLEGYIEDISKMRQAIIAQETERAKYENLIENDPDPVYIDKDGRIVYANPACVRFFKAESPTDLIGVEVVDLITDEYIPVYKKRIEKITRDMTPNPHLQYAFKTLDGSIAYADVSSAPFTDEGDLYIHVYMVDLSATIEAKQRLKKIQKRTRDLVINMTEGIGVFSGDDGFQDRTLVFCNRSFRTHFDMRKNRIIGHPLKRFMSDRDNAWFDHIKKDLDETKQTNFDINRDDELFLSVKMFYNREHELVLMSRDVTAIKQTEKDMQRKKDMLEKVFEATDIAVWRWNLKKKTVTINARWLTMLGYSFEGETTVDYDRWQNLVHPDDLSYVLKNLQKHINGDTGVYQCEYRMRHKDGGYVWVFDKGRVCEHDQDGNPLVLSGIHQDVTERINKEKSLSEVSRRDHLTDLYNRRAFDEYLLKQNKHSPVTLVMADINNLKLTNDAFGHDYGDRLLKKVSDILKEHLAASHFIARIGGDEFVFIMPDTNEKKAKRFLRKITKAIAGIKTKGVRVSLALGLSTSTDQNISIEAMYKEAERRMYEEKINYYRNHDVVDEMVNQFFEMYPDEKRFVDRLCQYAKIIGSRLGLNEQKTDKLNRVCKYHHIGKYGIDEVMLQKNNPLSPGDDNAGRSHPQIAYRILVSSKKHQDLADIIMHQNERWDGKGYPNGLKEKDIPKLSRILAIAKACSRFDIDTAEDKPRITPVIVEHLKKDRGKAFDPAMVDACANE